jgi:very-short-patch-repair endonuclease
MGRVDRAWRGTGGAPDDTDTDYTRSAATTRDDGAGDHPLVTPQAAEGARFHIRRQAPFRGYFLDFVCFERRLVVELDGSQHGEDDQADHDFVRDLVLKREGGIARCDMGLEK